MNSLAEQLRLRRRGRSREAGTPPVGDLGAPAHAAVGGDSLASAMRSRRRSRSRERKAEDQDAPGPAIHRVAESRERLLGNPPRGPWDAPVVSEIMASPTGVALLNTATKTNDTAGGTDAVVPLALVSARPRGEWAQPLQTHVRTSDGRVQSVPRDEWVARPYTRSAAAAGTGESNGEPALPPPTMSDTLRSRREARKTAAMEADAAARADMAAQLNRRELRERLERLQIEEAEMKAKLAEDKALMNDPQGVYQMAIRASARVDTAMPQFMKRMPDFHADGKRRLAKEKKTAEKEGARLKAKALLMEAKVDSAAPAGAHVEKRNRRERGRRVARQGGQGDGSERGWRENAVRYLPALPLPL